MDYQLGPGPLQVDQNTIDEKIKGDIGIVENGDVATHAIPSGYYVIWKGDLYVAKTDISSGTTLSTSNLTAKPNGIGAEVAVLNSKFYSPQEISDCNDAKIAGFYRTTKQTANLPFSGWFTIVVMQLSAIKDMSQIAIEVNTNRTFTRVFHDGTTWTDWQELALNSNIENVRQLHFPNVKAPATTSAVDFNTLLTSQVRKFTADTVVQNSQHAPSVFAGVFCAIPVVGDSMGAPWGSGFQIYITRLGVEYRRKIDTDGNGVTTFGEWTSLASSSKINDNVIVTTTGSRTDKTVAISDNPANYQFVSIEVLWNATTVVGNMIIAGVAWVGSDEISVKTFVGSVTLAIKNRTTSNFVFSGTNEAAGIRIRGIMKK